MSIVKMIDIFGNFQLRRC